VIDKRANIVLRITGKPDFAKLIALREEKLNEATQWTGLTGFTRFNPANHVNPVYLPLRDPGLVRLPVGVVAGAHQRPAGSVLEAQLVRLARELVEGGRLDVARHRQVMRGRLQVLPDRQHVHVVRAEIAHHRKDFSIGFS
jgi:hypothetical protein